VLPAWRLVMLIVCDYCMCWQLIKSIIIVSIIPLLFIIAEAVNMPIVHNACRVSSNILMV